MSMHECRRAPGEGFCRTCGRFMGDPEITSRLDDWTDPETLDLDPDEDPESVIYRNTNGRGRTYRW